MYINVFMVCTSQQLLAGFMLCSRRYKVALAEAQCLPVQEIISQFDNRLEILLGSERSLSFKSNYKDYPGFCTALVMDLY